MGGGPFPSAATPAACDGNTAARNGVDKQTLKVCDWPKHLHSLRVSQGLPPGTTPGRLVQHVQMRKQCTEVRKHERVSVAQGGPHGAARLLPRLLPRWCPHLPKPQATGRPEVGLPGDSSCPREERQGGELQMQAHPPPSKGRTEARKDHPEDPR